MDILFEDPPPLRGRPKGSGRTVLNLQCPHCPRSIPTPGGYGNHLRKVHGVVPDEKWCAGCEQMLPLTDFSPLAKPDAQGRPRVRGRCARCHVKDNHQRLQRRAARLPTHVSRDRRKGAKRLGLTLEQYDEAVALAWTIQDGKCAICSRVFSDAAPYGPDVPQLDHRHSDGVLRGLLCKACNLGVGYMQDSAEHASRMVEYLSKVEYEVDKVRTGDL